MADINWSILKKLLTSRSSSNKNYNIKLAEWGKLAASRNGYHETVKMRK